MNKFKTRDERLKSSFFPLKFIRKEKRCPVFEQKVQEEEVLQGFSQLVRLGTFICLNFCCVIANNSKGNH